MQSSRARKVAFSLGLKLALTIGGVLLLVAALHSVITFLVALVVVVCAGVLYRRIRAAISAAPGDGSRVLHQ